MIARDSRSLAGLPVYLPACPHLSMRVARIEYSKLFLSQISRLVQLADSVWDNNHG